LGNRISEVRKTAREYAIALAIAVLFLPPALAAETVRAGVFVGIPFVTDNPAELPWAFVEEIDAKGIPFYGMAIDLWTVIEKRLGLHTTYREYKNLGRMIDDLADNKIDIVLTNLTVTYERAKRINYTYPWYDGGLRIAINTKIQKPSPINRNNFVIPGLLLLAALALLSVPLMIIRARREPEFPKDSLEGFTVAFRDLSVAIKSGKMPVDVYAYKQKWLLNILSSFWTLMGVGIIAVITSTITTVMTTASLTQARIQTLQDLDGYRIGVVANSMSESILTAGEFTVMPYNTVPESWSALIKNDIDAFVYDAPVLEYYNHTFPHKNVILLDHLFHDEHYAFATYDIGLADSVSTELIRLHEDGTFDKVKKLYTGGNRK
jgi:ABC-type amino acid transport substrate-binding protein